jgi:hypothetical protein
MNSQLLSGPETTISPEKGRIKFVSSEEYDQPFKNSEEKSPQPTIKEF